VPPCNQDNNHEACDPAASEVLRSQPRQPPGCGARFDLPPHLRRAALPVKCILLGFTWLYAHHFFAGIRYLLLDLHWGIGRDAARASAKFVFVLGALATLLVAWRVW